MALQVTNEIESTANDPIVAKAQYISDTTFKTSHNNVANGDKQNIINEFLYNTASSNSANTEDLKIAVGENGEYSEPRTLYSASGNQEKILKISATSPLTAEFTATSEPSLVLGVDSTFYDVRQATTSALGGIKLIGTRTSAITTNSPNGTTGSYLGVEVDNTGKAFINVPKATNSTFGILKVKAVRSSTINSTVSSSGIYYGVELDSNGTAFVRVPTNPIIDWNAETLTNMVKGLQDNPDVLDQLKDALGVK